MYDAPAAAGEVHAPDSLHRRWLFWACFIALVATSFGFIIRAFSIGDWAAQYGLTETQMGEINGAGLWPFAISIIGFSLIIDWVGYGRAMVFAFVCHVVSALATVFAPGHMDAYWALYLGQFIVALANGTVEAVINPVVATMFPRAKTKWLAILHAGWPGGMVLAGLTMMGMDYFAGDAEAGVAGAHWKWKVALILVPTAVYGLMMARQRFPQQERVTAGTPYRAMLGEAGLVGMFIALFLIVAELMRVASTMWPTIAGGERTLYQMWGLDTLVKVHGLNAVVTLVLLIPFGIYVRGALGKWLFVLLLLLMLPLATTELGTDAWIKELMGPAMADLGERLFASPLSGGWVLIYSATVMMVLRFAAGPLVRAMGPLGLLAVSAGAAAVGLTLLSSVSGLVILIAATVYAIGQTFFWPCMLGVVAERFPRGGALTLNTIAGVGMLGVGIVGTVLLGAIQNRQIDVQLATAAPQIHQRVMEQDERFGIFGAYRAVDPQLLGAADAAAQQAVTEARDDAKQAALLQVAAMPLVVCVCFVILILYFRSRGGYRPEDITHGEVRTE